MFLRLPLGTFHCMPMCAPARRCLCCRGTRKQKSAVQMHLHQQAAQQSSGRHLAAPAPQQVAAVAVAAPPPGHGRRSLATPIIQMARMMTYTTAATSRRVSWTTEKRQHDCCQAGLASSCSLRIAQLHVAPCLSRVVYVRLFTCACVGARPWVVFSSSLEGFGVNCTYNPITFRGKFKRVTVGAMDAEFLAANDALLTTIPSGIAQQRDMFLEACGISPKSARSGAVSQQTVTDINDVVRAFLPFVNAQLAGDSFDFGTLLSTIQQKVGVCGAALKSFVLVQSRLPLPCRSVTSRSGAAFTKQSPASRRPLHFLRRTRSMRT